LQDLKERTIRGGFARLCAQAANFLLRLGSLMILARLLGPKDFGLVGMVTAFTGILSLFRDFGLSSATIQRANVTDEQISTLFWMNLLVGALLGFVSIVSAPLIASFYHEPRLTAVTMALAAGFVFNAAGVQHGALLQRQMRFTALAVINTVGLLVGTAIAIGGALAGYGYWALVAMSVMSPLVGSIGYWIAADWIPGAPRRRTGIRSLVRFGGTITLNGLVAYVAYNLEKVLLGRFWGADAIGLYGRAYQLSNIPTENLNSAVGEVAFSALSRVQDDPPRLKSYFLKGYSLVVALTIPITIVCAFFADDVILVLLGPQWKAAVAIFRLLAPTMLVFAIINPLGWLLYSLGLVDRSLKIALVFAPTIIIACVLGLPYGPKGVAFAYSAAMALWVVPFVIWAVKDTVVSCWDIMVTAIRPLAAGVIAAGLAVSVRFSYSRISSPLPRLALESSILMLAYLAVLLFATGQRSLYLDLIRGLKASSPIKSKEAVSV
jgi:O-antigen/teichoic acid export membrane protein